MSGIKRKRNCRCLKNEICYSPVNKKSPSSESDVCIIGLDEFEVMRLCDLENKSQIKAAEIINISRGTVQRILKSGRKKLIDALLNEKCLKITKI